MSRLVEIYTLVKRRQRRRAARRRSAPQRVLVIAAWLLGALSVAAAVAALAAWPLFTLLTAGLPPVTRLPELLDAQSGELLQPTRIYDRSGAQLLASLEPPGAPRQVVGLQNLHLAQAFVASQEPDFWRGDARPSWDLVGGPHGIAERLVARLLLGDQPDGAVKTLRARLLAGEALARYGPEQVLAWALDSADFGYWTFGQQSAARLYFGKPASQLSLGQAALLAAVAQAPALNPFDAPELARAYQQLVLAAMLDQRLISQAEFAVAFAEDLEFAPRPDDLWPQDGFRDLVVVQLEAELGRERVHAGGLSVTSTQDFALQQALSDLAADDLEIAVLDPVNGQVLGLLGDRQAQPAAELLVPFAYLDIFGAGYSPASLVWDLPATPDFDPAEYLGPTTMRAALGAGQLRPVQGLLETLDGGTTLSVEGDLDVLAAARAYGALAARGLQAGQGDAADLQPSAILFVADVHNRVLLNWTVPQFAAVTSPELAFLVSDVLADASLRSGAAAGLSSSGRPLALAPGASGWALGYSPQRVLAVWGASQEAALAALGTAFAVAHRDLPTRAWEVPGSLLSVVVCVPSGQLPGEDCPQRRREYFLLGAGPTAVDALYERIALNSLNGSLATVFTPQEFVRRQLFLRLPAEAADWAAAARIPQPPQDYDGISAFNLAVGPSSIARPAPFAALSGQVTLLALLDEEAAFYDVQVGQGLWPDEWLLLAEGRVGASGRALVTWDTSGLSGLWAIQLQTWDEEGVLTRAYSVVTIED